MRRFRTRLRTTTAFGQPSLSLDFLTMAASTFDNRITFTRSSSATLVNASGVIESVTANTPRFDYDPVTLAPKGLLIEEQRTNLLLRSEEFDNASWTKSRTTVTANVVLSPDGTVDADRVVEDTAAGTHRTFQQVAKAASNLTRTFSVYLKAAERTFARVSVADNIENVVARTDVDLSAGTTTAASVVGGTSISASSASISAVGNDWYRVSLTATFDATITNPGAFIFLCTTLGGISYTGDGTSGIYAWGAQWEDGAFATSYIPTVASQVTRTADVATITGANFSQWYNQSEGTFVAQYSSYANTNASTSKCIFAASDGTTNNRIYGNVNSSGVDFLFVAVGGVAQANISTVAVIADNAIAKFAGAYKANDFAAAVNGGAVATDTSGSIPTVDRLSIGNLNSFTQVAGHIRSLTYYPTRLTNAQLQALTA